ncbi:MAG: hypothetical protein IJN50_02530 [Clostridia bacterium]|nr:hypothetical protein [Clostridia bacterium]
MKKLLTLTIFALIALFAIPTMVQAGNANSEATLISEVDGTDATITLKGDIELTSSIEIGREVTIDLNGYTITDGASMTADSLIIVLRGGKLTIKDSVGTGKIAATNKAGGRICVKMTKASGATEPKAVLVVESGTLEADSFAISGNGNPDRINTEITINGGKIIGKNAAAIFHPQLGTLVVNGGHIEGTTGIEMRSGDLEVNGGTIVGNGDENVTPNGSGSTVEGAGIAISQHTTKNEINVVINGGEVKGVSALVELTPEINPAPEKVSIEINGGNFEALEEGYDAVISHNVSNFISGGSFNTDVEEYMDDSLVSVEEDGVFYVGEENEIKVEKTENGTVKASKDKAVQGQTVELTITPNEGYKLKSLNVITAADSKVEVKDNKFTMPDLGVIVSAEFEKIPVVEEKDDTPKTGSIDVVLYVSAIIATISLAGIVLVKKYTK